MMARLLVVAGAALLLSAQAAKAQDYSDPPSAYDENDEAGPEDYDYAPRRKDGDRPDRGGIQGIVQDLYLACQSGDRAACVRFGWMLHERQDEEWRRLRPEFYWWERR